MDDLPNGNWAAEWAGEVLMLEKEYFFLLNFIDSKFMKNDFSYRLNDRNKARRY